jgi:hypothetical protein
MSTGQIKAVPNSKMIIKKVLKSRAEVDIRASNAKVDTNTKIIDPFNTKTFVKGKKNEVLRYDVVYCEKGVNDDDEKQYDFRDIPKKYVFYVVDYATNEIIFAVERKRLKLNKNRYANKRDTDWVILNPKYSMIVAVKHNSHLFTKPSDQAVATRISQIHEKVCKEVKEVQQSDKHLEKFITSTTLAYKERSTPRISLKELGEASQSNRTSKDSRKKKVSFKDSKSQSSSSKKMTDDNNDSDTDDAFGDFLDGADDSKFKLPEKSTSASKFSENHKKLSSVGKKQQKKSKRKTSSSSSSTTNTKNVINTSSSSDIFKAKEFPNINVGLLKSFLPSLSKRFRDKIPKIEKYFSASDDAVAASNDYDYILDTMKEKFPDELDKKSLESIESDLEQNKKLKNPASARKELCKDREIDFEYWCSLIVHKSQVDPRSTPAKFLRAMTKTISTKHKDSPFFYVLNNKTSYADFGEGDGLKLFAGYLVLAKRVIEMEQLKSQNQRKTDGEEVRKVFDSYQQKLNNANENFQNHIENIVESYKEIQKEYNKNILSANEMARNHVESINNVTKKYKSENNKLLEKISDLQKTKDTLVSDINNLRKKQSKHSQELREQEIRLKREKEQAEAKLTKDFEKQKEASKQRFAEGFEAAVAKRTTELEKQLKKYREMYELSGNSQNESLLGSQNVLENLPDSLSDLSSDDDDDNIDDDNYVVDDDDDNQIQKESSSSSSSSSSEKTKRGKKRKSSQDKLPKRHQKIIDSEKDKDPQDSLSDCLSQLETPSESPNKKQKTQVSPSPSQDDDSDSDDFGLF